MSGFSLPWPPSISCAGVLTGFGNFESYRESYPSPQCSHIFSYFPTFDPSKNSGFQILFFILFTAFWIILVPTSISEVHWNPPCFPHETTMIVPRKSLVLSPDPSINPWQWTLAATAPHELFIFGFQLLRKTIRTAVCIWITINHVYVYISLQFITYLIILYSAHRECGWCADSNVVSSCHIYCQFIYHSCIHFLWSSRHRSLIYRA